MMSYNLAYDFRSANGSDYLESHRLNPEQLKDGINFSHKLDALLKDDSCTGLLSECCPVHVQMKRDLFCKQCGVEMCSDCVSTTHRGHGYITSSDAIDDETWTLEMVGGGVVDLLEEVKRAVSVVRETKRRVTNKKDNDVNLTREVFSVLRKAIDEREEQTIVDIKEEAIKKEKSLEVSPLFGLATLIEHSLIL